MSQHSAIGRGDYEIISCLCGWKVVLPSHFSRLAITQAQVKEDAENIDSLILSAPYNHPYLKDMKPMSSEIVCKKGENTVFEGRALDDGIDFYNTHTWTCESALAYLKDPCSRRIHIKEI